VPSILRDRSSACVLVSLGSTAEASIAVLPFTNMSADPVLAMYRVDDRNPSPSGNNRGRHAIRGSARPNSRR
jgi:hypothetical protein